MGSDAERKRYETWKRPEDIISVSVITNLRAGQSFQLTGTVHQFKQKFLGKDQFIPMVDVSIEKLIGKTGMAGEPTTVPFAAVNKNHIEAISLVSKNFAARAI